MFRAVPLMVMEVEALGVTCSERPTTRLIEMDGNG